MNVEAQRLCAKLNDERLRAPRTFDLRDAQQRRVWERIAYLPRVDYGEDVPLKPNFHLNDEGNMGWMDE